MSRIALVTGANRGIGFAICQGLGRLGHSVILTARDPVEGQKATAELRGQGLDVHFCRLDVTSPEQVEGARVFAEEHFGRLDILVNNAALYPDEGVSVFDLPLETLRQTFEVNTFGPFLTCQAFVPMMRRQNYGRVVNVSSEYGSISLMDGEIAAYKMSKAALNALTRIAAAEVSGFNIKVNTMCPGWVRTRMGGMDANLSPEEGADTALWLATLPDDGPSGGFFQERKPLPW